MTTENDILKSKLDELQQVVCKVSDSEFRIDDKIEQINLLLSSIEKKKLEKEKVKKSKSNDSGNSVTISISSNNSQVDS